MESLYGFVVTRRGRNLFAKLGAGYKLEITKVMFGTGKMPEGSTVKDMMDMEDLVTPLAEGTGTTPIYEDDTVSMVVEFRSDLNGGLKETSWLNEFGVFANDPDLGEVLILYATLGDYPDSVKAFKDGRVTVRDYPISVTVGAASEVVIDFSASAFITSEEAVKLIAASIGGMAGLATFDFTIQADAWNKDESTTDKYAYYADVENECVSLSHLPDVTLDKKNLETACSCGMASSAEIFEAGKVRFFAMVAPSAEISGTCKLWTKGKNTGTSGGGGEPYELPVASATTLGCVKIGEGISIASDGTISADGEVSSKHLATEEEASELLEEVFGNKG